MVRHVKRAESCVHIGGQMICPCFGIDCLTILFDISHLPQSDQHSTDRQLIAQGKLLGNTHGIAAITMKNQNLCRR